jgi:hypothetical protein
VPEAAIYAKERVERRAASRTLIIRRASGSRTAVEREPFLSEFITFPSSSTWGVDEPCVRDFGR